MPTKHTERLDVEDDAERELRLGQLLERINDTTGNNNNNNHRSSSTRPSASSINAPFDFERRDVPSSSTSLLTSSRTAIDFGVRETHAVEPPRELLARLDSFLPQMEAANAELACRMEGEPSSVVVDIREIGEEGSDEDMGDAEEEQYIEMNVGLGVFDIRRRPTSEDADKSSAASSPYDSSEDDSHSASASDSDASHPVIPGSSAHRPIRPPSPRIIVLGQSTPDDHPPPSQPDKG